MSSYFINTGPMTDDNPIWIMNNRLFSYLRELRGSFENTGMRIGFRIVAWMERSRLQEGGVGRGRGNGVRE
jgi:hypothetical protein